MSALSDEFQTYLADDESILDVGTGRLDQGATQMEGEILVTDRRLLFVSGDTGFTDVRYDQICSIRSWPQEGLTTRGLGVRLLTVAGVLLAVLALVAQMVLLPTVFVSLLALVAVGAFIAAEALRRTGVDIDWTALNGDIRDADYTISVDVIRRCWEADTVCARQILSIGAGLLGVVSAVSLLVLTGRPLAFALTFLALGGLAVADYGVREIRRLDRLGESRRTERNVTIQLVGGGDTTFQLDSTKRIDRVLSRSSTTGARDQRHDSVPGNPEQAHL